MVRKIGILTSGGDAPGMNAAIRAVTRVALSNGIEVVGVRDGYRGLLDENFETMTRSSVSDILDRGGTKLGSARLPEFKEDEVQERCVATMKKSGIDALVVIGGDGSYRGALALTQRGINCIGLPGTIDNDIPGTDFTIGFDTALHTCVECVDKLRDTSSSHHRASVVEVMGNHCGDLALYTAISCGAEMVITPETGYDELEVLEKLRYLGEAVHKNHAIIIISEKIT
ncbi:MAG: ATP-dependent 6-phosphofructokinase, partial [Erysipelotrichaceae bacterium]|nr:ATP-dependent 6-phosphofructokinase [Erysipelotrichaceae bacterium]